MTQEEKNLLHKDLCSRLPYGVHVQHRHFSEPLQLTSMHLLELGSVESIDATLEDVKPYLFPLSSMTEEQCKVYHELVSGMFETSVLINFDVLTDFFNANHLDYRGLIPMGLAVNATGLNIY